MEASEGLVRVFLVDDHEVVRRGVAEVLEEDPGISVVGEAGSVSEALARVPAVRPDVTVVDMRLPDGDGAEEGLVFFEGVPFFFEAQELVEFVELYGILA